MLVLADAVLQVLDALDAAGLQAWLDGGWGVDALLGTQTRQHDDVDIVVELERMDEVLRALEPLGFRLVADHLPTRAVLRTSHGCQVDLHPVQFDVQGTGWQRGAAPDGADCPYPAGGFARGHVLTRVVPCLSAELQVEHHCGYEPRAQDRHDMAALGAVFGITLPHPY